VRATVDAVIIGAGILGAAIAYELSQRGVNVALVERAMPNRQGSGTTAGNLHIQAIHTRRPGQDIAVDSGRLVPFQRAVSDLWDGVEARLGTSVGLTRCGGFTVAETDADIAELEQKIQWEHAAGIPTEILTGDEARAAMPLLGPTVRAATWCPWDGHANALLATPAYLKQARASGAEIRTQCTVRSIRKTQSGWDVDTDNGDFSAAAVVNAGGPWIEQLSGLAGYSINMSPLAIQMHETVRAPRMMESLVQHIGQGLSVKQVGTGNVVIGGGWPAGHLNLGGVSSTSEASTAGNMAQVARILPDLARLRLSRVWAGPLAATPDEMPVVGEVTGSGGFFIAGGTYAFTFSPLWALLIADLVTGNAPSHDISGFTPDRLLPAEAVNS
jgi:sarcosine oxidase subunit beta